jgi:hypothetical protein
MTEQLKSLMKDFNVLNEADLFCPANDYKEEGQYIGDSGKNNYDIIEARNNVLEELKERFNKKFREISLTLKRELMLQNKKLDDKSARNMSRCIIGRATYLATYWHPKNAACQLLLETEFAGQTVLKKFNESFPFQSAHPDFLFDQYKRCITKGDGMNRQNLIDLINVKKVFCVPWLLCHDVLLSHEFRKLELQ